MTGPAPAPPQAPPAPNPNQQQNQATTNEQRYEQYRENSVDAAYQEIINGPGTDNEKYDQANAVLDEARLAYAGEIADRSSSAFLRSVKLRGNNKGIKLNSGKKLNGGLGHEFEGRLTSHLPNRLNRKANQDKLSSTNLQFKYEVAVGVVSRFHDAAVEQQPLSPDDKAMHKKMFYLITLLGDNGQQNANDQGELFKLNKQVRDQHVIKSNAYERKADGSVDLKDTLSRRSRMMQKFYARWNQWTDQGFKGVAKKAAVGIGVALVGAAATATGAIAFVGGGLIASGIGAAAGGGVASRVGKTYMMTKLNRNADIIRADDRANRNVTRYENSRQVISDELSNGVDTNALDANDLKAEADIHTRSANLLARKNRTRVIMGILGVGGALGLGTYLEHAVANDKMPWDWFNSDSNTTTSQGSGNGAGSNGGTTSNPDKSGGQSGAGNNGGGNNSGNNPGTGGTPVSNGTGGVQNGVGRGAGNVPDMGNEQFTVADGSGLQANMGDYVAHHSSYRMDGASEARMENWIKDRLAARGDAGDFLQGAHGGTYQMGDNWGIQAPGAAHWSNPALGLMNQWMEDHVDELKKAA